MHELSVAMNIVDALTEELASRPDDRVVNVHVRVGALSSVVPEGLEFCWDEVTSGTRIEGARLTIDFVKAVVWCPRCREERELPEMTLLFCPACGEPGPEVRRGWELEIVSMELEG